MNFGLQPKDHEGLRGAEPVRMIEGCVGV